MKTPDYVLTEEYEYWDSIRKEKIMLEAGTFVRPIDFYYLPRHIKVDKEEYRDVRYIFCYCRLGIISLPKDIIREI